MKQVKVPKSLHERLKRESDDKNQSIGHTIRDWKEAYDRQQQIKEDWREAIETRGDANE